MNLDLIAVTAAMLFIALLLLLAEDKRHDYNGCKKRAEVLVLWHIAIIFLLLATVSMLGTHLISG